VDEDAQAARHYRQRTREVRAVAKEIEDAETRVALLKVARDYEALALPRLRMGKAARSARRPGR
jgi:hypothetical protein